MPRRLTFSTEQTQHLLNLIGEHVPINKAGWHVVWEKFHESFPHEPTRDVASLRRKFNKLRNKIQAGSMDSLDNQCVAVAKHLQSVIQDNKKMRREMGLPIRNGAAASEGQHRSGDVDEEATEYGDLSDADTEDANFENMGAAAPPGAAESESMILNPVEPPQRTVIMDDSDDDNDAERREHSESSRRRPRLNQPMHSIQARSNQPQNPSLRRQRSSGQEGDNGHARSSQPRPQKRRNTGTPSQVQEGHLEEDVRREIARENKAIMEFFMNIQGEDIATMNYENAASWQRLRRKFNRVAKALYPNQDALFDA